MVKNFLLAIVCACGVSATQAQGIQSKYTNGKELFELGKYELAMQALQDVTVLSSQNPYAPYASYYYALAAYRAEQRYVARDMLLQIEKRFNGWKQLDEAKLWLVNIYFELGDFENGIQRISSIRDKAILEEAKELELGYLRGIDSLEINRALYEKFDMNENVGLALAEELMQVPLAERNIILLDELAVKFESVRALHQPPTFSKENKKSSYKVAVMLPFNYSNMEEAKSMIRSRFVLDLYQGIKLGMDSLRKEGVNISMVTFDTKRSPEVTAGILANDEMQDVDLIIGPLFPEPSKLVSEFSYEKRIIMINPVSSNDQVIGNNPFSFLYRPGYSTQAKVAAAFMSENVAIKKAMIYFENTPRALSLAANYKNEIEGYGFEVFDFQSIDQENIQEVISFFTSTFERDVPEEEVDSLMEAPGHFLKLRRKENSEDPDEWYEELLNVKKDSVGHVFVASNKPLLVANFISALDIRRDSIPLVGQEEWLDYTNTTYEQLERLGVSMLAPRYYKIDHYAVQDFRDLYLEEFYRLPSINDMSGYDVTLFVGRMLNKYGTNFQAALRNGVFYQSTFFSGQYYANHNDNQVVPMIQLEDSRLKTVTEFDPDQYSRRNE